MSATLTRAEAEELLYREALYLDRGEWDAWLDLYLPDAIFWMPAWRDETTLTDDPDRELSLIYYRGRRNLARAFGAFHRLDATAAGGARRDQCPGGGCRGDRDANLGELHGPPP